MIKRFVSAWYPEFYPFNEYFDGVEWFSTSDPDQLREGDRLIVWGGGDISPSYYGRSLSPHGHGSVIPGNRDRVEWAMMNRAKELGIPIIGICRGAQMLCALNGGYLIQHVNGHGGHHTVVTYDGKRLLVNSLHHQMMMPDGTNHEMIAWTEHKRSNVYYDEDRDLREVEKEPEFIWFPDTKGVAVQWHPEMMGRDAPATEYVINFIKERL